MDIKLYQSFFPNKKKKKIYKKKNRLFFRS